MTQTILVIGATNPVGSALIRAIPDDSAYAVRVAIRPGAVADYSSRSNVTTVAFDFFLPETYEAAFAGVDKVFLVTPFSPSLANYAALVADGAKAAGVKHIVDLSSLGVGKAPEVPLFALYRQMEESIEASGIPFTHLRSAPLMDNFLNIHPPDAQGTLHLPIGEAAVCWIAARDVAAVAFAVLIGEGHEGKSYDLTGPQALTVGQAAAWIGQAVERDVNHSDLLLDGAMQGLLDRQFSPWVAENLIAMYGVSAGGDAGSGVLSVHSFLGLLGDEVLAITGTAPQAIAEFAAANAAKLAAS